MTDPGRPRISGSKALHCRMETWLAAHGYPEEAPQPGAQRTFALGHMVEAAMFRTVTLLTVGDDGELSEQVIGPFWDKENPGYVGEVRDFKAGKSIVADMSQLSGFQREVSYAGYKGHIDALMTLDSGIYVPDVKTTQGFGYDRHLNSVLLEDVFAREYVGQLHFYMKGLKDEGLDIAGGVLIFYNKENSQVMARFVDYSEDVVAELTERLSWAKSDGEPEPDWKWEVGQPLPLRSSYCSYKQACAQVRGLRLEQTFDKKNKPVWIVRNA